ACIVLTGQGRADPQTAVNTLFEFCRSELAYFKAPGWIWLTDELPTTSTQKIQKHQIFPPDADFRTMSGMIDLRSRKRR
ncbi:MAG TPA: long-chain fatty acid--CoA ligase, partial [Burkholderiaceae bacterium]|nr:long-chain fatty acid--CoA ligase [Burkholderiaceae bacterium]